MFSKCGYLSQFSFAPNDSGHLDRASENFHIGRQESFSDYCLCLRREIGINFLFFGNDALKMLNSDVASRFFARLTPCEASSVRPGLNEPLPHLVSDVAA